MPVLLLLLSFLATGSDEMASEKYCFDVNAEIAAKKFEAIKVPSDFVTLDENCLIIQMRPHRRELIQRFLLSSIPGARVAFSSEEVRREPCRLKVEKEKVLSESTTKLGFDPRNAQARQTTSKKQGMDVMRIETLSEFEMQVNQDKVKGTCRFITPKRYDITLEVVKLPRPVIEAPLPPGTIIVINNPPQVQQTMKLKTTLQLNQGDRLEVGEILTQLKNQDNSVSLSPSGTVEKTRQTGSEKVCLGLQ